MGISMIRSMDSQGRIVIPMEIRKQLHLLDGEALEIEASDTDIRLRKCIPYASVRKELQEFLSLLHSVVPCGMAICNQTCILLSKGLFLPEGIPVTEDIKLLMDIGKEHIFSEEESVYPVDTTRQKVTAFFPIKMGTSAEPIALLLCTRQGQSLTEMELGCAKLVSNILIRKFQ